MDAHELLIIFKRLFYHDVYLFYIINSITESMVTYFKIISSNISSSPNVLR